MSQAKKPPKNAQPFESLGETWWLSEVTQELRSAYASMIRSRARQQIIQEKAILSPEEYDESWERFQSRIDSGAYEWGPPVELGGTGPGKAIVAAHTSDEGSLRLIQLLLLNTHGELELTRVAEIIGGNPDAVSHALREALGLPPLAEAPAETKTGEKAGTTSARNS